MVNNITLIGRIGEAPEVKSVGNGDAKVVNTSLATNSGYYDKNDNWVEETQWHRIVAWNKLAERFGKLDKGQLVYVTGELRYHTYKDKNDVEHTSAQIIVGVMKVLNNRSENQGGGQRQNYGGRNNQNDRNTNRRSQHKEPPQNQDEYDDLPF